jgi:hypothetical protein
LLSTTRPCLGCGSEVKRLSKFGRIPNYCTDLCRRLTKVRRWYWRHRDDHCALRRARYSLKKARESNT